jgi:hypothetical protein
MASPPLTKRRRLAHWRTWASGRLGGCSSRFRPSVTVATGVWPPADVAVAKDIAHCAYIASWGAGKAQGMGHPTPFSRSQILISCSKRCRPRMSRSQVQCIRMLRPPLRAQGLPPRLQSTLGQHPHRRRARRGPVVCEGSAIFAITHRPICCRGTNISTSRPHRGQQPPAQPPRP